jgi:hypothetical protein
MAPAPNAYLLDLEALLVAFRASSGLGDLRLCGRRIGHIDVGHVCGSVEMVGCAGVRRELLLVVGDRSPLIAGVQVLRLGQRSSTKVVESGEVFAAVLQRSGDCESQGSSSA